MRCAICAKVDEAGGEGRKRRRVLADLDALVVHVRDAHAGVALREAPAGGKAGRYLERADAIFAGGGLGAPRVRAPERADGGGGEPGATSVRADCRSSSGVGEYEVEVQLGGAAGVAWSCSCPLAQSEPVCKHALALLLFCERHFEKKTCPPEGGKEPGQPPQSVMGGPSQVKNWTQELIDTFLGKPREGGGGGAASQGWQVSPTEQGGGPPRGTRGEEASRAPGPGSPNIASPDTGRAPALPAAVAGSAEGPGAGAAAEAPAAEPPPAKKARTVSAKDRLASLGF